MTMRHPVPTLPRAAALCDLVLQDAPCPEQLDGCLRTELARRLAAAAPSRAHGSLRLDSWRVMNPIINADSAPFAWSPSTARRLLGAPAARHVVEGARPTPLVAVRAEMARLIGIAAREPVRSGSLAMWLHEAPRGLRAQVLAEATTWATELVTLLDWERLDGVTVGGGDPVWAVPGAPWITLRARRDLEVPLAEIGGARALVCMRSGRPSADAATDLRVVALADAMTKPDRPVATRVVGVWPAAGRSLSLEVAPSDLAQAARDVVAVAARLRTAPLQAAAA